VTSLGLSGRGRSQWVGSADGVEDVGYVVIGEAGVDGDAERFFVELIGDGQDGV
jgi:hypothetical protein